ncbi:MAG: ATP-binding cassette domain-containing protein [Bacteroidales bacterium]|nr:ATP-binding cassette domain-containing protein [Bacteroidales bacterium]
MFLVQNISILFSGKLLFDQVSFLINSNDKIGLVGANGTGKSTLLKLLAGELELDGGEIIIPEGKTIGYLPQELKNDSKLSIYDETQKAFHQINSLEKKIEKLNQALTSRTDYESAEYMNLAHELSVATERYQLLGGQNRDADLEKVLLGLGFTSEDFSRSLAEFSGGWRMRVEIAKILLQKPDLLLLDEPVNHLDIESIEWLEQFLKNYFGAVVLVAHDRVFLDSVTSRTIEISKKRIYDYKMSYSAYVLEREERMLAEKAAYINQQKQIQDIEQFIERFRYQATKAKQVQSRVKMLEKMERIEVDTIDRSSIKFRFQDAPSSGKIVAETHKLNKRFGDNLVLKQLDFVLLKGEKIAFVGKNGMGKTTLAKIIVGEHDYEGEFKLGYNVKMGYYAQNQAEYLDLNKTVFETIDDVATGDLRKKVRDILGAFLFSGESIDKKVSVLSGGEKSRLALAKLLLEPYNLLVLDEPTNHLDIQSKSILKNALMQYNGSLIIVSHDRDFLQGLTDKVIEFKKASTKTHLRDIQQFLEKRKIENFQQLEKLGLADKFVERDKSISDNKQAYLDKKENDKELRKIENKLKIIEQEITQMESEIEKSDNQLADPEKYKELIKDSSFFESYQKLKTNLESRLNEWERISLALEEKRQN